MNGISSVASLVAIAALGPIFGVGPGRGKPPQPFTERVTLPGRIPQTPKSLSGSWHFGYMLREATLESGKSNLIVGTVLTLREDGTYFLHYHARWNLPGVPLPGSLPTGTLIHLDGRNVTETGRFSLSGEVLLLEPDETTYSDLDDNTVMNRQSITNKSRALIVRVDKAKLSVAGRCASYQVDPVCLETPIVWHPMSAQLGTRWLGRDP